MPEITMKALDLFCGLGGWSDGLALEGFEVLGIEINPDIAKLYKHPVICEDIKNIDPDNFKGYDLIVGSPPCRDFTILNDSRWKNKKNPNAGMELIKVFLNFIAIAEPRYWLLENVPGLKNYLDIKPRCKANLAHGMHRCFWGNFPAFLVPKDNSKPPHSKTSGWPKLASWERAKIPLPVSRALGKTVRIELSQMRARAREQRARRG